MVTKERMAALGRLSAAIAHEIRQPLTAMTGALKELARLAPLEDDDKKLVQIVSRESQRLNQIITDFLDYSREKNLQVRGRGHHCSDRRNACADRARCQRARQIPDRAPIYRSRKCRARADRDAMKQVLWNLCNNALRAMPDGGRSSVGLEASADCVRISIPRYRRRP